MDSVSDHEARRLLDSDAGGFGYELGTMCSRLGDHHSVLRDSEELLEVEENPAAASSMKNKSLRANLNLILPPTGSIISVGFFYQNRREPRGVQCQFGKRLRR